MIGYGNLNIEFLLSDGLYSYKLLMVLRPLYSSLISWHKEVSLIFIYPIQRIIYIYLCFWNMLFDVVWYFISWSINLFHGHHHHANQPVPGFKIDRDWNWPRSPSTLAHADFGRDVFLRYFNSKSCKSPRVYQALLVTNSDTSNRHLSDIYSDIHGSHLGLAHIGTSPSETPQPQ